MPKIKAHTLMVLDDSGADTGTVLAQVKPAKKADVKRVLKQSTKGGDGRSNWVWVRLQNGDLILGVYPQGATYEEMSAKNL